MNEPRTATVAIIKVAGRFKAMVGEVVEYGDYATTAARTAAAKFFGVPEAAIEVEPDAAVLTVRVKSDRDLSALDSQPSTARPEARAS